MNRVLLSGRLAGEPELRTIRSPDGRSARTRTRLMLRTDPDALNPAPAVPVDVFDRLGEVCAQYLVAGVYIEVEGRLATEYGELRAVAVDAAAGGVVRYVTSSRSRIANDFRAEVGAILATKEA